MALYTSLLEAGDGRLTGKSKSGRRYIVSEQQTDFEFEEIVLTETRVWEPLTEQAARDVVAINEQPTLPKAFYSYGVEPLDQKHGGFQLVRSLEYTTIEEI